MFRGGGEGGLINIKKYKFLVGLNLVSVVYEGLMDRVVMLDDEIFVMGSDNGDLVFWSI